MKLLFSKNFILIFLVFIGISACKEPKTNNSKSLWNDTSPLDNLITMELVAKKNIKKPKQKNIPSRKTGQLLYVPVYSEVYAYNQKRKLKLSATLSIHNTDPEKKIFITSVGYYNSRGKVLMQSVEVPIEMQPLETKNYVIEYYEKDGGVGANFLVEWQADTQVSTPIVETVMISVEANWGISFVGGSKVIKTLEAEKEDISKQK